MFQAKSVTDSYKQFADCMNYDVWTYYRMGDYKNAVARLEQAVVLEPSDPDVNDHLGDAYWRIGRKVEAGYQWRRVLTLEPAVKLKASVEAKIKSGLDAPVGAAVVAGQ